MIFYMNDDVVVDKLRAQVKQVKIQAVLDSIRPGDAGHLAFALSGEWSPDTCICEHCIETTATIRKLMELCCVVEGQ